MNKSVQSFSQRICLQSDIGIMPVFCSDFFVNGEVLNSRVRLLIHSTKQNEGYSKKTEQQKPKRLHRNLRTELGRISVCIVVVSMMKLLLSGLYSSKTQTHYL